MTEQTNNIDELLAKGKYNDAKNICMQIINSGSVSIQVLEKLLKCKIKLNEECKDVFTKIIIRKHISKNTSILNVFAYIFHNG